MRKVKRVAVFYGAFLLKKKISNSFRGFARRKESCSYHPHDEGATLKTRLVVFVSFVREVDEDYYSF